LLNQLTDNFLRIISICGGIFVLYLAWSSWREWRAGPVHINTLASDTKWSKSLVQGMIMNFLSPGPYIFWLSVTGPILLSALRSSYINAVAFLLGFYGVFIGSLIILVIMFDQTRRFGVRVVNTLLLLSIFILGIFGIILLRRGLIS
jgi:threonine/homoserine/homoserine lactone efflux protein